jgi:hypothetical protein
MLITFEEWNNRLRDNEFMHDWYNDYYMFEKDRKRDPVLFNDWMKMKFNELMEA